jgi:hypothetical protein
MNKSIVALAFVCFIAISCAPKAKPTLISARGNLIDSFEIQLQSGGDERIDFRIIDSSTIITYDPKEKTVRKYKRGNSKIFEMVSENRIEGQMPQFISMNPNIAIEYVSRNILFLDSNYHFQKELATHLEKKFLKENFTIIASPWTPFIFRNDTLISTFTTSRFEDYGLAVKEPAISEYVLRKDTMYEYTSYLTPPESLIEQMATFPRYCYNSVENKIVLIYGGFDALYVYDRNTKKEISKPINNPFFVKPQQWNYKDLERPEATSLQTKYMLHNFVYESIFFNPSTQQYLLFFGDPGRKFRGGLQMNMMLLDKDFNCLHFYQFDNTIGTAFSITYFPNKGYAIPQKADLQHENRAKYYVYNF